jgi:putative ABC transport system permease protein
MTTAGRGIRNAFRNATRTVSIILILGLAIGLAVVMLTAHRSVSDKIAATLGSVGNTVTIGPPGYSAGGPLGSQLTTAELAPVARLHGVTGIDESLDGAADTLGAASNPCPKGAQCRGVGGGHAIIKPGSTSLESPMSLAARRVGLSCEPKPCTPPVTGSQQLYFTGTTEPTNPVNIGASTLRIVSGHAIPGTTTADVAMVSTAMARKNRLEVGSTFTAYGKTLTVAAIFATDNQSAGNTIVTSLPVLQHLTGAGTGQVFTAVVTVKSINDLAAVTSAIERTLGPKASVVSYTADAEKAAISLGDVKSIALFSLTGAVVAAVVILFLVMVIIVRERKREIGILKAIGASNGRIAVQFTTEAATFTLLGLAVGAVVGVIAASPVTSALVSNSGVSSDTGARGTFGAPSPFLTHLTDIDAQVGWGVILGGLAAALAVSVLASAAAAWMIGRIRPAQVLRSE